MEENIIKFVKQSEEECVCMWRSLKETQNEDNSLSPPPPPPHLAAGGCQVDSIRIYVDTEDSYVWLRDLQERDKKGVWCGCVHACSS